MTMLLLKLGSNYVFVFSFVLVGCLFFCAGILFNFGSMASGQLTNSSAPGGDEILANINQTYLSLIPLMIQEVQNTNASDIPIRQIIEATPSNATQLQDIVKNNSYNSSIQSELNSTYDNTTLTNSSFNNMPSKPQDLIPVVVNMTQNTNATELGFMRVINSTPTLESFNGTNTN